MVYSKKGEIRFDDLCLEANANQVIKFQKCSPGNEKQIWNYDKEVDPMEFFTSKCLFSPSRQN